MSPALIGGLVGLAFAVAEYFLFGALIERAARRGEEGRGPRILDLVRKAQLVLFPVIGLIVGAMLAKNSGVS
jgi:hypothetical protein